jgi:hypothetical protein
MFFVDTSRETSEPDIPSVLRSERIKGKNLILLRGR